MAVSKLTKLAAAGAALAAIASCQTMGYYAQAVGGQMELWQATRPIEQWVADEHTEPQLRERLERIAAIRDFASRELMLPDNQSFRGYADLHRPYVVWNVFAAPEFSLEPVQWCFPFAGCVAYRGYFSEENAQRFASKMDDKGLDVFVGGVPASSTLGWFDDPVLNTFVNYHEAELARLMFHELAHQIAYVCDDTAFNESFATAVELEGVRRWIESYGTPEAQQAFDEAQARKAQFLALVTRTRTSLKKLYSASLPEEEMRAAKVAAFRGLHEEYSVLKSSWGGFNGYDRWFQQPLNNAKLVSVAAYFDHVDAFQVMIRRAGGDLGAFYEEVRKLAKLPKSQRLAELSEVRWRS